MKIKPLTLTLSLSILLIGLTGIVSAEREYQHAHEDA